MDVCVFAQLFFLHFCLKIFRTKSCGGWECPTYFQMSLIGVLTPLVENLYFYVVVSGFLILNCYGAAIFSSNCFLFGFLLLKTTSGCREMSSWQWGEVALLLLLSPCWFHEVPLALPACHELLKPTATKTCDLFSLTLTQCHRLSPGHLSTSESPPSSSALAGYHTVALHTHCCLCLSAISLIPHYEHKRTSRPLSCCVQPEMILNTGDKSGMG